jgi:hypothetical protein
LGLIHIIWPDPDLVKPDRYQFFSSSRKSSHNSSV